MQARISSLIIAVILALGSFSAAAQTPPNSAPTADDRLQQAVQAADDAARAARDAAQASARAAEALSLTLKPPAPPACPAVAPPPPPPKLSPWAYVVGLNLISDTGNATAFAGKLTAKVTGNWANWATLLQANGAYGQAEANSTHTFSTTSLNADLLLRGDRKFSDAFSVYVLGGVTTDHVASVAYTGFGEAGVSITWYERKETDFVRTRVKTDFGFRYTHELDFQFYASPTTPAGDLGPPRDIPAARAAVSFLYAISKTSVFTEDAEVLYDVIDPKNVRFTSLTAISAELAKGFALSLSFKVRYIGVPALGAVNTDTELSAGITFAF